MGPEIPEGELAVLARNERVEIGSTYQRVRPSGPRRILIQLVFIHPLVRKDQRPGLQSFNSLPVVGLLIGDESARERSDLGGLLGDGGRIAGGRRCRSELARRRQQHGSPVGSGYKERVRANPHTLTRWNAARPNGI